MSYYIRAWIKGAEIEADILRLRERVSSVHRRFTVSVLLVYICKIIMAGTVYQFYAD